MDDFAKGAVVSGGRIRLRALREADLPLTLAWRNDDRSLQWFKSQELLQWGSHLRWFHAYAAGKSRDRMFFAETLDGTPVGQSSIYNFDSTGQSAEVGRFLSDPELRGQGLFRDALALTLVAAFDLMGLADVHLEVLENNERAMRLYRSAGFAQGTTSRGVVRMNLQRADFVHTCTDVSVNPDVVGAPAG